MVWQNSEDEDGWTPFMWACRNGHKDVVQLLLDQVAIFGKN